MRQLTIKVRARANKEALNLGFMVARRYGFSLLLAILPLWAVAVALALAVWWLSGEPLWAVVVLWWLKPLYERPPLLRLSRLVFQEKTDFWREQRSAFARGIVAELPRAAFIRTSKRPRLPRTPSLLQRQRREQRPAVFTDAAGNGVALCHALPAAVL